MDMLPCNRRMPTRIAFEMIIERVGRFSTPTYVGAISLELRCSIARAQELLDELEAMSIVRPLTQDEKTTFGCPIDANVYFLTDAYVSGNVKLDVQ